jgi:hypothetical protein
MAQGGQRSPARRRSSSSMREAYEASQFFHSLLASNNEKVKAGRKKVREWKQWNEF